MQKKWYMLYKKEMEEENDCCAICLSEVSSDERLRLPGCGHLFHVHCALDAAQSDVRCPVCRQVPEGVTVRKPPAFIQRIDFDIQQYEARRAARKRYVARRRRFLNSRPDLLQAEADVKRLSKEHNQVIKMAQEIYDRECRNVRARPDVVMHRQHAARLRRKIYRLQHLLRDEVDFNVPL